MASRNPPVPPGGFFCPKSNTGHDLGNGFMTNLEGIWRSTLDFVFFQ